VQENINGTLLTIDSNNHHLYNEQPNSLG